MSGSGMMKRRILKELSLNKKKWGLSLILAGIAALNVGFTEQTKEVENSEVAQVEEVDILPAQPIPVGVEETSSMNDNNPEITDENIDPTTNSYDENISVEEEIVEQSGIEEESQYLAVMSMEATAYLPTDGDGYGITATGIPATYGVAAVDPAVIPLGSRLYIPGYGEAIAADTGGAIYGYRIDLCMESYSEAIQFGRRNVTVYVLK